jgi:hypothetical protein
MEDARAAVKEYKAAAERFVALVEECETGPDENDEGICRLGVQLAALYFRASQIPEVELPDDDIDVPGDPAADTSRFFAVLEKLHAVVAATLEWGMLERDYGIKREETLVETDLAEVHHDVVNDLARIANGERDGDAAWRSAVWEVRFGFWGHWGHHATSALIPLHAHLDCGGGGPRPHRRNLLQSRRLASIETTGLHEEDLELRVQVGRHLVQVAKANGQDERASFRAAFEMSVETVRKIHELHVESGQQPAGPLTERERRYLEGADDPP